MFFKKKKASEENIADREIIAHNSKAIEVLIVICEDDEIKKELRILEEKLKYLMPSPDSKIIEHDKKIKAHIEDMKILMTKSNGTVNEKITGTIRDLKVLISERNSRI